MKVQKSIYKVFLIGLTLFFTSCLKEDELNFSFKGFAPVETNDGWLISGPNNVQIDSTRLIAIYNDLYNNEKAWAVSSMLVIRSGKLIAESYLKSENDRSTQRAIWSCTKQVTSLITGIAISEGYIKSVNDPISDYLPEIKNHLDKKNITVANLLSMQSGIFYDNGYESDVFRMRKTYSSVDYVLSNKLQWLPGSHFQYNDGAPQLISAIIQHTTGMTMDDYANLKLFSKIGLTNYQWKTYTDGVTFGAFGLLMPPRELAKIAKCVCDSGKWNGIQVVPKQWLTEALETKVANIHGNIGFGYFWWVNQSEKYVFMWGHGGQFAIIYPEKELIVVITGLEQIEDDAAFRYQTALNFAKRISDCIY